MCPLQIALFAIVALAAAAPQHQQPQQQQSPDATAETLRSSADVGPESYQWQYETSNQIKAQEQGQLKQIAENQAIAAQGDFSYVAPDGTPIQLSYVADENGFQPQVS